MNKVRHFNNIFVTFEAITQANFIARLKQEQYTIRKILIRIQTIRETSFVSAAYAIAEITTALLVMGFLFAKIEPFYESLFFVGISTFLLLYMIFLIRDLDNPFNYYTNGKNATTVSLQSLLETHQCIKEKIDVLDEHDKSI